MRCPKCGYNSFDHLDSCKKCGKDLVEFKQSFGIKSVLFPGQMSATGFAENVDFDSESADAAVSVATGAAATTAANVPSNEPMTDGADGEDFGFDFMGDSAEDDDLSFDELFEEAPEDEDIEETIEAPKAEATDSEPEDGDDFSFDLPDEEDELDDDFGFDPVDESGEPEDSGTKEGPTRPFDLPESSQSVEAPEAELEIFAEIPAVIAPAEEDAAAEVEPASSAPNDVEDIYILDAAEVDSSPQISAVQFELEAEQDEAIFVAPVLPLTPQVKLAGEVPPVVAAVHSEEVVTGSALPRPPLGSCVGAFLFDVALLAIVGISFVVAAEAAMSTEQTRLFPSMETLIDLSVPYFLVLFFLAFGYFTLFHFLAGQTPGKMLLGLRVEATDGEPLVFSQAFLRSVGGLFQLIPVGLGYLLILTSAERRGWNDRLAGTRVIALRDLPLED